MKQVKIVRGFYRPDGTLGVLGIDNFPICVTLERKWEDNKRGISCIPSGDYILKRVNSPKFGETFEITNVRGRSEILFHKGNIDDDTHGCVILGESFEPWADKSISVRASKTAFDQFMFALNGEDFCDLSIRNAEAGYP